MSRTVADGVPFLKIMPLTVAGILLTPLVRAGIVTLSILWAAAIVAAVVFQRKRAGSISIAAAILLTAMMMTELRTVQNVAPQLQPLEMQITVTDNPSGSGRLLRCNARLERFCSAGGHEGWRRSGERIILYADTSATLGLGNRYSFFGTLRPIAREGEYEAYGKLMRRRGFTACCFVPSDEKFCNIDSAGGIGLSAKNLQRKAVARFDRLGLPRREADICKAMAFGWRATIDSDHKEEYARSGTAHLLAVSGLHVGIVVMLVNVLLYLLPLTGRRGHLVKNVVAVAVIWLYALLTGATPSVVRAAAMFSGLQAGLAYGGERSAPNILFGVATVMLLVNPNYLYDISFQLSFLAVAGIVIGFKPLMRLVESRSVALNAMWGLFIVGLCSSIATAPIAAYAFGRLPLVGIFLNIPIIFLANIVVLLSLLWCIAPVGALSGLFAAIIGTAAEWQNRIVGSVGLQSWASVEVSPHRWAVVATYGLAVAALIVIYGLKQRKKRWRLER